MYSAFGWKALYVSIKSIWFTVSFKASVSLLIFCLGDLSIDESGLLTTCDFFCWEGVGSVAQGSKIFLLRDSSAIIQSLILRLRRSQKEENGE